jgi:hypothetical protein
MLEHKYQDRHDISESNYENDLSKYDLSALSIYLNSKSEYKNVALQFDENLGPM